MARRVGFGEGEKKGAGGGPERPSPQARVDAPARRERGRGWLWLALALGAVLVFLAARESGLFAPDADLGPAESGLEALGARLLATLTWFAPVLPFLIVAGVAVALFSKARLRAVRRGEQAVRESRRARDLDRRARSEAAAPGGFRLIPILFLLVWLTGWSFAIRMALGMLLDQLEEGDAFPSVFLAFWLAFAVLGWVVAARLLFRLIFGR